MKYFTPDLLTRFASQDDDIADEADDEWERAIQRYHRRIARIKPRMPEGVRRLRDNHICLHDAEVLRIARNGNSFVMVLETEPPTRDAVVLTFVLNGEPVIDRAAVPNYELPYPVYWLYEEWDIDRAGRCNFEVLLSNGWSVKLPIKEFRYLIGKNLLPGADGESSNGKIALPIESAVGKTKIQMPHEESGPNALPHFQPGTRPPAGRSFYETDDRKRKARTRRP